MKVGSLFSGVGGIEIGFEKQGFETEWFVECELYAKAILKKRFPSAKIYDDITKIDFRTIPKVDILTGGFPCQDISNAGKRIGIEGSRSSLWKYYLRAIRILRPKYAVIENVAALTKRGLNVVLADLAEIGYDAEWYNLSASAVGANHRRERIFIISYPNSIRHIHRESKELPTEGRQHALRNTTASCEDASNTINSRQQREGKDEIRQELLRSGEHSWATEPKLGRVADGISNRVDRIKCLGNAVVPQVAEVFAKAIKEYEMTELGDSAN